MMTDMMMPGMGGKELAVLAKVACPSMKVLFMTGYAEDSFTGVEGDEVIMKPFAPEALEGRLRDLLPPKRGHGQRWHAG
jgi:DNA-binding response OmpR family regulator